MDRNISIILKLTIGAFVLTVLFFALVIIDRTRSAPAASSGIVSSKPELQEIDHPGQKIFKANCTPCHRIHQKLIGPALAGVFERRDSLWVINMIRNSSQLIASGDPTAVQLFREYNGIQMTSFNSLSEEQLRNLLEYIKLESTREDEARPAPSRVDV